VSSRYSQIRIALDLFNELPRLEPAGQSGDRVERVISFEGDLPVPIPHFSAAPRVIVTPVRKLRLNEAGSVNILLAVGAVRDVTPQGFRLVAYNRDPDFGGTMAFNWVAIEESPDATTPVPDLVTGVLPLQQRFASFPDRFNGRRTFHDGGTFGAGLFDTSVASVQLTATDHGVDGHSVAAVGSVDNPEDLESRKAMQAHNVDVAAGGCAFNWTTFSLAKVFERGSSGREPAIETGAVAEQWFSPGGEPGDWKTWDVLYSGRFATPPVVLLTPAYAADIPERLNAAVVGIVQEATSDGFRLAARSCDLRGGLAGFNWIAISNPS